MAFNCPSCRRSLENRRRAVCPFCHATIPADVRGMDPGAELQRLRQDERQRLGARTTADGRSSGADASFFDFGAFDPGGCDCGGGGDCGT